MKSYEQMARDVLRRRDAELKKRKRAFLIGAPCAAAAIVAATAVGVGAAVSANRRGRYIHPAIDIDSDNVAVSAVSGGELVVVSSPADYTNPNAGQTNIVWLSAEKPSAGDDPELDEKDFREYTLEGLDRFYDLRFNRLGKTYTDWKLSYDKLGVYRREFEKNGAMGMETYYTRNTLSYTTESGAKVTVSAQRGKFEPVSDERLTADKPTTSPETETKVGYEYDKDGNVIGETVAGYAPDPAASVGPAPTPDPDEGVSTVNGYEALIYRLSDGSFLADLDMNSRVRITAEGISDEKFLEILDNFTK